MTLRFRRSLTIFPGVKLHFGNRGIGISAGVRGAHVGISSNGRPYASAGIPGTGIYARSDFKKGKP